MLGELHELEYGEPIQDSADFVFADTPFQCRRSRDDGNLVVQKCLSRRHESNDTAVWGCSEACGTCSTVLSGPVVWKVVLGHVEGV